jgi:methylated-DNA-[protein]-cysteine S-methyltransferase
MRPKLVQYEAPGFGVGELWLDGDRVLWSEHPRPSRALSQGLAPGNVLARRLQAFFAGEPDNFLDVDLDLEEDGFFAECARALRAVPRGEVVTYGELAALAGRPGAARAAGTFCGRNKLGVFIPCHRVVSAGGIGTFGDLGIDYKRRMLALEGVVL